MARLLFICLDGVGLGTNDPSVNPLSVAAMPHLQRLLDGRRLLADAAPFEGEQATLLAVDACLGIDGSPQSATGQGSILTGRSLPAAIGTHYGPKPNKAIAGIVREWNLFSEVLRRGGTAALLNAYPPRYFDSIRSRHRLYSSIPLAATSAGLNLLTADDLQAGRALSADFTGEGWVAQPGFPPAPVYTAEQAGAHLARLAADFDLAWFDYWPSDYAGHRGSMQQAVGLLETFDAVLGGLVDAWPAGDGMITMTADHGNLEDLKRRGHTRNPVPALLIGPRPLRTVFANGLTDLTGFAPAALRLLFGPEP
jgi:hypothetical protein